MPKYRIFIICNSAREFDLNLQWKGDIFGCSQILLNSLKYQIKYLGVISAEIRKGVLPNL